MQALSCGSPSMVRGDTTMVELGKSEVFSKPATDRLISMIRLSASKPDLGTPMRVPLDSNGQRLCPTPKSARALDFGSTGMKNHASRALDSPAPFDMQQFNIVDNPTFQPLGTIIPTSEQKQPLHVPVDSNGQRPCPTPKSTTQGKPKLKPDSTSSSPGGHKLRFPKATPSFQPLETIQSPTILKDPTRRVLGDSNGQWKQETPKASKQFTTPRERSTAIKTSCSENMTPRTLFNDSQGGAPRSVSRVTARSAAKHPLSSNVHDNSAYTSSANIRSDVSDYEGGEAGLKIKKRTRDEEDGASDDNTRVTRSKTEAERIASFLKSPAVRIRLQDGSRQEYRGTPSKLSSKLLELTGKETESYAPGPVCNAASAIELGESSLEFEARGRMPLIAGRLSRVEESPAVRVRCGNLLQSPSVKSSMKPVLSETRKTPAIGGVSGRSSERGSAKKNLSVLLEAEK